MGCPLGNGSEKIERSRNECDNYNCSEKMCNNCECKSNDSNIYEKTDSNNFRVSSSIPKSQNGNTWTYPSGKMFANALKRKGHNQVDQEQIENVVIPIHNIVNEKCWAEICKWERITNNIAHPSKHLTLIKFMGRPDCVSPKAFLKTWFVGFQKPFDRHDWFVSVDGKEPKRFVIDFYEGKKIEGVPVSIHVDVRPAFSIKRPFGYFVEKVKMFCHTIRKEKIRRE